MSLSVSTKGRVAQSARERLAAAPETQWAPIPVGLESANELINFGLREMLSPYADRIVFRGSSGSEPESVVRLVDPYGDGSQLDLARLLRPLDGTGLLVFYTWRNVAEPPELATIVRALRGRLRGWLSMRLPSAELVSALERIYLGEIVIGGEEPPREVATLHGLTQREQDVIILITAGLSNQQIADQAYVTINSVKSYIRSAYRKIGVTSRSQAVLWGVAHGLALGPDHFWAPRVSRASSTDTDARRTEWCRRTV